MSKIKKSRTIYISIALTVFMVVGSLIGILVGCGELVPQIDPNATVEYNNAYKTKTKVGYEEEFLGEVERHVPDKMENGGLETGYPTYGSTLKMDVDQRNAMIAENKLYCGVATKSKGGTFDKMDENGVLYLNGQKLTNADGSDRKLFKHSASVGLYNGNVADDEPAISKKLTYMKRGYEGYGVTGMYAPAGELITVKISKQDMEATGGITIHIGQALFNGQANDIWNARDMNRMPILLNTMEINPQTATLDENEQVYTAYVGSFLGGPIYVRNESVTFSVEISGGVRYSHFILGYTTKEEFELNKKSSAPYFDLEVWENGVLHSGPKVYAEKFSYEDLYKVAVYWDKVALVSTKISTQGIVFLYDPFVAAGAAVAFPGRSSVNCPMGWMSSSLNYDAMVTSGAWGNMHEYNHNFQSNWGKGEGGEVTNNAVTLIEYSLFTKISSSRQINNYGADGLSGWNRYTSATWALNQTLISSRENDLSPYATILHSFGQDMFIKAIKQQQKNKYSINISGWARAISEVTHNDMTYFFNKLVPGYSVDSATQQLISNLDYPTFIPVASVYQTGRSFEYDDDVKYITTQKPYQIDYGKEFTVDLRPYKATQDIHTEGSIILPTGFSYKILNVTNPANSGTITPTEIENVYKYTPGNEALSGQIIVTLEITAPTNSNIPTQKVDLVLEFEQTRSLNKNMLERTTYYYDTKKYTSAKTAFENGYDGYREFVCSNNVNTVQNSNTDLWYTTSEYPNNEPNRVVEIKGKIYADEDAKYRIALRGRYNVALYISIDNKEDYRCVATYTDNTAASANFPKKDGTYYDMELKAGQWVYFKEVMIGEQRGNKISFIGLGWGKFTPPAPVFNDDGEIIEIIEEKIDISYASAYRNSFEFEHNVEFTTPYFYTNEYNYDYQDIKQVGKNQTLVQSNYSPWTRGATEGQFDIQNLFNDDSTKNIHTIQDMYITESNPFYITIDLNEVVTANKLTFNGYTASNVSSGNLGMPKDFILYGKVNENDEFFKIAEFKDQTYTNRQMVVSFDYSTFRYFKLYVTKTDNNKYFAMNNLKFTYEFEILGGKQIAPDNDMLKFVGTWQENHKLSTFGRIMVGQKDYTLKFMFTGTRFGILSSTDFENNFEVYVDGVKINSIALKQADSKIYASFMSDLLQNSTHNVEIKCLGQSNIDSIVIY